MKENKRRDVLFLCQFFYPEYVSSATLPFDTAKRLAESGLKVGALCGYPKEYSSGKDVKVKESVKGIQIHRVKYVQLKRSSFIGRIINYFSFTCSILGHFLEFKKYKTVIVYSNPPILPLVAVWAKKFFKTRFIFVAYDLYPEIALRTNTISKSSIICKTMNYINKKVYSSVDKVIALSSEMKEFIIKSRNISKDKVQIIPNWYEDCSDIYKIENQKNNRFYEKYRNKFIISYLGNMGICQDMETIVETIRELKNEKDICFLIAGHGNKADYLKEIIKKEQLENVEIYDFLQGDAYHEALAISKCSIISLEKGLTGLCSPSKAYGYMMAGNVLIAIMEESDIVNDIQDFDIGFAIKNGDYKNMAMEIKRLRNNPELVEKMQKNCIEVFKKKYTTEICTGMYEKLLWKICRG